MTIQQAIEIVDRLKPNTCETEEKIHWLTQLDGQVVREIIQTHEQPEGVTADMPGDEYLDTSTELRIPAPYDEIYLRYLEMQIDLADADLEKYQNSRSLFNSAYLTYMDYYNRYNAPITALPYFVL